jgi:hypothetical protein
MCITSAFLNASKALATRSTCVTCGPHYTNGAVPNPDTPLDLLLVFTYLILLHAACAPDLAQGISGRCGCYWAAKQVQAPFATALGCGNLWRHKSAESLTKLYEGVCKTYLMLCLPPSHTMLTGGWGKVAGVATNTGICCCCR